ncbi:MAG TPA: hypothetical protein VFV99_19260 [Kofleriaceae bacterium]|nr:hypothetical protein [Kofleriaceae bacterium]
MGSRWLQRVTLAVAAGASIATTQLPQEWHADASAVLDAVVFDTQRVTASYAIHAEIAGTGKYTDLDGTLTATISATTAGTFDAQSQLRLTLRSTTNPDVQSVSEVTLPNIDPRVAAELPAWTHCMTPPCAEDFELTVELIGTGAPPLNITGNVGVRSLGTDNKLEATTQTTIIASPLP